MWAYETYPEVTEKLRVAAIQAAFRVLESYQVENSGYDGFRFEKGELARFLRKSDGTSFPGIRYVGNNFYPNYDWTKPVVIDVTNLYLSLFGFLAGGGKGILIKELIETKDTIEAWINEWREVAQKKTDYPAFPLALFLFIDILNPDLKIKDAGTYTPEKGFEKLIAGDYGELEGPLHDEVLNLRLGYFRQRDRFADMENFSEEDLKNREPNLTTAIFYMHKGLGFYNCGEKGKLTLSMMAVKGAQTVIESLPQEKMGILDYDAARLERLINGAVESLTSGTTSIGTRFKEWPDIWRGWHGPLTGIYDSGLTELKKITEEPEGSVRFSTTWGSLFEDAERLSFWAHRSALESVYFNIRKIKLEIFLTAALALGERSVLSSALGEAILVGDGKAIEAIAREYFPWDSEADFEGFMDWAYEARKDRTAYFGVAELFKHFVYIANEETARKILDFAEEGINRGFSFTGEYDYGRPAVNVLANLAMAKKGELSESAFRILDEQYALPFSGADPETPLPQVTIRAIRNEVVRRWARTIRYLDKDSPALLNAVKRFEEISRDDLKKLLSTSPEEMEAWGQLLTREEALSLLKRELEIKRKGDDPLLEKDWYRSYPIVELLNPEEKEEAYKNLLSSLGVPDTPFDIKPAEKLRRSEVVFPSAEPYGSGFVLSYWCDPEYREKWLAAASNWLISRDTIDELYNALLSTLSHLVDKEMLTRLREARPEVLERPIYYWGSDVWEYDPDESFEKIHAGPSEHLIRFMALTIGKVFGFREIDITLPYDEVFKPRGMSIDSGVSLAVCLGLLARETNNEEVAEHYIGLLSALTNWRSARVAVQAIYGLDWARKGPAGGFARKALERLFRSKDRAVSPVRVQLALDSVEESICNGG